MKTLLRLLRRSIRKHLKVIIRLEEGQLIIRVSIAGQLILERTLPIARSRFQGLPGEFQEYEL